LNRETIQSNKTVQTAEFQANIFVNGQFVKGNFFKTFEEYLVKCSNDWIDNDRSLFAPIATVVQSSGHGKTRAMYEFAKTHISVYICLRSEDVPGFPITSEKAGYFLNHMNTEQNAVLLINSLLNASFKIIDRIKQENSQISEQDIAAKFMTYQPWAYGTSFYKKENVDMFNNLFESASKNAANIISFGSHSIYIFLDEAGSLLEDSNESDKKKVVSKFRVMRRAIYKHFKGKRLVFALADTNSLVSSFVPNQQALTGSEKSASENLYFYPSFFKILFIDKFVPENDIRNFSFPTLYEGIINRNQMESLFLYGRPLWSKSDDKLNLAREKLICASSWNNSDQYLASIAVFSVRTTFSLNFNIVYGKSLVARYMSTLFYIDENRQDYAARYFSEPIFAEVGADIMNDPRKLYCILSKINEYVQTASLNISGAMGEIVAQTVLLTAFDSAVKSMKNKSNSLFSQVI
jgi:hypothetical protein